jgi:hypothetical protein
VRINFLWENGTKESLMEDKSVINAIKNFYLKLNQFKELPIIKNARNVLKEGKVKTIVINNNLHETLNLFIDSPIRKSKGVNDVG